MGRKTIKAIYIFIVSSIFASFIFITSCNKEQEGDNQKGVLPEKLTKAQLDSIKKAEIAKYDIFPKINYTKVCLTDAKTSSKILAKFKDPKSTFDRMKILATLNRKEARFFYKGDTIVVPDTIIEDLRAYSIFPQYFPGAKDIKKFIVVTAKFQAYACYEYGKLIRFAATNTGKERTQTYPGRYALEWKEAIHRSSIDSDWVMPYNYNFQAEAGNAFHQFVMPGRPVSHSCCRQFMDDARWLFYWGDGAKYDKNRKKIPLSGTPVIILDHFDFARKKGGPWLDLKSNKDSIVDLPDKPMEFEEALIPWCQIPDMSKGSIRNKARYLHAEDTLRKRGVIRPGVELIVTKNFNQLRREKAKKGILPTSKAIIRQNNAIIQKVRAEIQMRNKKGKNKSLPIK